MSIDASIVKQLREKTGAGMMDCKKALVETAGNVDEAINYLRKSGIAKAEKKVIEEPKKVWYSLISIMEVAWAYWLN